MTGQNKRFSIILLASVLLLLIPLVAMQFTAEVNWTAGDFVVGGVLLFGAGLLAELAMRKIKKFSHRIVLGVTILVLLLFTWVELAVGILGTPFAGS